MLRIRDLSVHIGRHEIVSIDELDLPLGRRVGLVGESGSGKTMTAMSLAGLAPREACLSGSIVLDGHELVGLADKQLATIRGAQVGVIFQDPLRALNPMMRIGRQIDEAVRLHARLSTAERRERVLELMRQVQLTEPESLVRRYPHQLSGGQRQRVLITMAIASRPKLLIADEPTTALDVTVQQEILELLVRLSEEQQMAVLFVSHDLGVVRAICDHVAVLYGGRLVETGPVQTVIHRPRHRYTEALIRANPGHASADDLAAMIGQPLTAIPGAVPSIDAFPTGCRFRDRCAHALDTCANDPPIERLTGEHRFACFNPTVATKEGKLDGATR